MFNRFIARASTSIKVKPLLTTPVRYGFFDRLKTLTSLPAPELTVEQYELVPKLFNVVLDVREPDELERDGKIPDSYNIPLGALPDKLADIELQMNGFVILCYCRSGIRSAAAAKLLRAVGVEAWNLKGGIIAYNEYKEAEENGTLELTQTKEDVIEHLRAQAIKGHKVNQM